MAPTTTSDRRAPAATGGVRALERGLELLRCFDLTHSSWTVSDLARACDLHTATTRRLVKTLEASGFLRIDETSGEYRLGPALLPLTYLARSNDELAQIAHPFLERLAAETLESVGLWVWTDAGMVQIDCQLTSRAFKPEMALGQVSSRYGTAFAKILLAFGSPDRLTRIKQEPDGPTSAAGHPPIAAELEEVREAGFALDHETLTPGRCGVGAPVRDSSGEVIACLAVVIPRERFGKREQDSIIRLTLRAAEALSKDLGHLKSPTPKRPVAEPAS